MKKYICSVCGYVYDPELGDPDNGIEPGQHLKIYQMIGFVRYVVLRKKILRKKK